MQKSIATSIAERKNELNTLLRAKKNLRPPGKVASLYKQIKTMNFWIKR